LLQYHFSLGPAVRFQVDPDSQLKKKSSTFANFAEPWHPWHGGKRSGTAAYRSSSAGGTSSTNVASDGRHWITGGILWFFMYVYTI